MRKDFKEATWVFALGTIIAMLWWVFWVQPRDEVLHSILDCMGDNRTEPVFEECRQSITTERQQ